jgi:tRNA(Ile)-lysidine synthase
MHDDAGHDVAECARRLLRSTDAPLLLAVSGGLDSMALLHAVSAVDADRIAAIATFDHGTGPAATAAVALVQREGARLGVSVVVGRLEAYERPTVGREAAWRRARYRFLRAAAAERGAIVVTAHTRDDQVETVLMRELRGSGARGLAALLAPGDVARPLLSVSRSAIARYAAALGLRWVEDPSNAGRTFLRNRVRLDLLPALRRVDPAIDERLVSIGARAAEWRGELDALVDAMDVRFSTDSLVVNATELRGHARDSLHVLWSALAARIGLALDGRGTRRCAEFTMRGRLGASIPLSDGWTLESGRGTYVLRRAPLPSPHSVKLPARGAVEWGAFRFRVASRTESLDDWSAELPDSATATVREWAPGDRLVATGALGPRRVKRYLSDAGVVGVDRARWPVVVLGDEVVWIPGVRRSNAATARSGRPGRYYVCERTLG